MGTKTEEYLRILAEGGDAPAGCCMTNEQKLIAEAIDRINNLQPGGGGAIVPLEDYVDISTFAITDKDGLIDAINAGKGFYMQQGSEGVVLSGAVGGGKIYLTMSPQFNGDEQALLSATIIFDEATGSPLSQKTYIAGWVNATDMGQGMTLLSLGKLTINIGGNTYEYDGMQDVSITIADGESMEF